MARPDCEGRRQGPQCHAAARHSASGDARAGRGCAWLDHVDHHVVGDERTDIVAVGDHNSVVRNDVADHHTKLADDQLADDDELARASAATAE